MREQVMSVDVDGERIAVTVDEPVGAVSSAPGVLLLPGFGMTAHSMLLAAYIMSANGLRVFRPDLRNQVGARAQGFRLSRLTADIGALMESIDPAALVAMSIAAPAALRAARGRGIALALVVPVVDVRSTLRTVCGEDWFERPSPAADGSTVQVLGQDVDIEFVDDCRDHGFVDATGTLADLRLTSGPVDLVIAAEDRWVSRAQARSLAESVDAGWHEVPGAGHLLYRDPAAALHAFHAATAALLSRLSRTDRVLRTCTFAEILQESVANPVTTRMSQPADRKEK